MTLLLSLQNIANYLISQSLGIQSEQDKVETEPMSAKNFNLLVKFPNNRKLLVKQERHDREGKTAGEFLNEWRIQEFLQRFSELGNLRPLLPVVLHFDAENSIIVFKYLDDYRDLADFYAKENVFPSAIASSIGNIIATIHRSTFNRQNYRDFFSQDSEAELKDQVPNLIRSLERITPEIFGLVPADGIKFFVLYQRYESLAQAMAELSTAYNPCCLTHNDLKLNNILLHQDWQQSNQNIVRLIDWERSAWGDPGFDLGTLIASYLLMWLSSLVISQTLTIEESLRLAATPLEQIQPSISAMTVAYFDTFPEIVEHRPDFLKRVVQFAGLALIQQIQAMIQYQKSFGNTGICMLQVAKSLLCRPEQSMSTVFGNAAATLTQINQAA
ncbi:aminoglycoside phosphotransferase family protein [Planktothrix sp. FACHB-1355]|uniref:Aminoglycoside phosphotransferase family protein n=1 Tax=Aerosakkonema funiforme FACHB-1375 TaxID=2949571 RepID=A0A926ZFD4_9CYAN|nr:MULTISPECIES: aminoglycoside phosphotransferase family protein [Oscillatoriales]MBD2180579.1 aminoglycoside phosphotransferase family protein [Aerosakkonema funiforme FACHB-1375]MBD3559777.1 aminoglycoside phosphotransferase family protein [Planktothrix sp. FACHB-1355]